MSKPYFMRVRSTDAPWVQCGGQRAGYTHPFIMQLTVSPDPYRSDYGGKTPDDQMEVIKIALFLSFEKTRYVLYETHFELNKEGNIHSHSLVYIPSNMNCTFAAIKLGKLISKHVGRPKTPWYVSSRTDSIDCEDKWLSYIRKDSVGTYSGKRPKSLSVHNLLKYIHEVNE